MKAIVKAIRDKVTFIDAVPAEREDIEACHTGYHIDRISHLESLFSTTACLRVACLRLPVPPARQTGVFRADVGVRGQGSAAFLQHVSSCQKSNGRPLSFADPVRLSVRRFD